MQKYECGRNRLLAAVTLTGAALWLTNAVGSAASDRSAAPDMSSAVPGHASLDKTDEPLSHRVERLREKLRSAAPALGTEPSGRVRNLVQFFNFLNCIRDPTTGKCK